MFEEARDRTRAFLWTLGYGLGLLLTLASIVCLVLTYYDTFWAVQAQTIDKIRRAKEMDALRLCALHPDMDEQFVNCTAIRLFQLRNPTLTALRAVASDLVDRLTLAGACGDSCQFVVKHVIVTLTSSIWILLSLVWCGVMVLAFLFWRTYSSVKEPTQYFADAALYKAARKQWPVGYDPRESHSLLPTRVSRKCKAS